MGAVCGSAAGSVSGMGTLRAVKATELGICGLSRDGVLADGALILGVSVQREWVYAKVVKDGRMRTRRYRHDQMVELEA